ncbi:hypothetical protein ANN_13169 [Periplaneta americana]|uniref:DUF4817 domain-containing protein n=1 Tax=Periplaneta americana TaxID=6978 RepID=A0ABQ8TIN2_PERAM|nr:hypothetical protein ANN_13169 [Periplaneta americana]
MVLTIKQCVFIVECYAKHNSWGRSVKLFAQEFHTGLVLANPLAKAAMQNLVAKWSETGSVANKNQAVQSPGHLDRLISLPVIFTCGAIEESGVLNPYTLEELQQNTESPIAAIPQAELLRESQFNEASTALQRHQRWPFSASSVIYINKVQSNHQLRTDVFTFPELANMVMCYGEARGNGRRALHIYEQQFQNRNHPHHIIFARLYQRLRDDGSLRLRRIGGRPPTSPASSALLLERFVTSPQKSGTQYAREVGISTTSVRRILKAAKWKVYISRLLQPINDDDPNRRMQFYEWYQRMVTEDEQCVTKVFYQQDGAPPHYHLAVRVFLVNNLLRHWIGRRGAIEFPPLSPDLTPKDFYLWGTVKDQVYRRKPRTLEDHRQEITAACAAISIETWTDVAAAIARRYIM